MKKVIFIICVLLPFNVAVAGLPGHLKQPYLKTYQTNQHNCHVAGIGQIRGAFGSIVGHINLLVDHAALLEKHVVMLENEIRVHNADLEREAVEDNDGGCVCDDRYVSQKQFEKLKKEVEELKKQLKRTNEL